MATKPFASAEDLDPKEEVLEILGDGIYALTAGGDPTVGAIEAEDFLICFEARATPYMAGLWLDRLRRHTDKPVRYLVLSHYHAVRTLGAAAFDADMIVASDETRRLISERGRSSFASWGGATPRVISWPGCPASESSSPAIWSNRRPPSTRATPTTWSG